MGRQDLQLSIEDLFAGTPLLAFLQEFATVREGKTLLIIYRRPKKGMSFFGETPPFEIRLNARYDKWRAVLAE